ncbi:hypothetical protein NKR19_g6250 [Coniochaeta hoffmannii]|uniref:HMG box domain-containing protein n=1 Tax=Coniochaeta hoffmannii TaxID=91930 RepID=A0AA38S1E5_9PEZI|nr:hypothetical protein NKR19_g6250 [Coniochaeta hoffmannii]
MWSSVRSTAARQLRVSRAAKVNTGLTASSRVASRPANFVIPTSYRLVLCSRSFSHTGDQLAAEKAAAKPRAKKSTTTTAAKKKKPAAKKATAKKAAGTKKTAKKPAAKRAAPKKRVRKALSPEDKLKKEVRELKKVALLQEPKKLPDRAWLVYVAQNTQNLTPDSLAETIRALASQYNSLGSFEKERLEAAAHQNRLANEAAYKAWVEAHSPVEIDAANRARQRLRRISPAHKRKTDIKDSRLPKRGLTSYTYFTKSKWATGELAGESFRDAASSIAKEWKSLSAAEKKAFEDTAAADAERYAKDVKSVLHREVRSNSPAA